MGRAKQIKDWSDLNSLASKYTPTQIADIKKCTPGTVRRALRKRGFKAITKRQQVIKKVTELYDKKQMSTYDIASLLNRPRSTIYYYVHNAGIARGRSEADKLAYIRRTKLPLKKDHCPHQFTIRIKNGYACLVCKKHFRFD